MTDSCEERMPAENAWKMKGRIWITWENQRRSKELAESFGCTLFEFPYEGLSRYPRSILETVWILLRERPRVLFVQNPSMILASLAVAWGILTRTFVVVDRHTTFLLGRKYRPTPWLLVFKLLHRFSIRFADLTLVTNAHLGSLVSRSGGQAFVLPDRLPDIAYCFDRELRSPSAALKILLISSFAEDEPIKEAIEGFAGVSNGDMELYVSGNYHKAPKELIEDVPERVTFTGFLPEDAFLDLLCEVDIVLVLTTAEYTMLCGCYEAVSAEKVLITSDKEVLREYFTEAIFVENTPQSIGRALSLSHAQLEDHQRHIVNLKHRLQAEWQEKANKLFALLPDT